MAERFKETVSTGIVTDTVTGKEYNCEMRIDDDFLNLVNDLANENEQLKQLNIPVNEIKDTVIDCKGRIIGVYYND